MTLDDGTDDADFARLLADGLVDNTARFNFGAACDYLRNLDIPGTLYYFDEWSGVQDTEPQGEEIETGETGEDGEPVKEWCEPAPYYQFEGRELMALIFDKELASYL